MPATYSPPYDSPIEDAFALHFVKYASSSVDVIPQFRVNTLCGLFIVDFVLIDQSGYRIGIECDGKEFHEESRDEWRDAMILGEGHLDVVFRLRGSDIHYYIEDVLFLMAELEPEVFDVRASSNLRVLASPEVQALPKSRGRDHFQFHYRNGNDIGSFYVEARRRMVPPNQRRFWQAAYMHAVSVGGGKLDDVISSYRKNCSEDN